MNIIEETKRFFSANITEADERSKKVNIKFETTQSNLPIDDFECYFMIFPERDLVNFSINFFDESFFECSNKDLKLSEYTKFVGSFDADDQCTVNIEITKNIVDSTFSVYMLDKFIENILNNETYKVLSMFSILLSNQDCLNFQCLDNEHFFWKTKTIAFSGINTEKEFKLKSRTELLNQVKENANCTVFERFHLLPDDFKIGINDANNKLTSLFANLSTFLSLMYISSFSTFDTNEFSCEINGHRNITFFEKFDSLKSNEEIYKIYNWAFSDGNVVDKLLIARNAISLHCKYIKIIDIDERTFESIKSNHQLYLKTNVSKYIEAKEQVSKFIVEIISQINSNISKLSGDLKNNFIAIVGFLITVILVNIVSQQPLDNIFTKDITKIMEIIIIFSIAYAIISIVYSNKKYTKQINAYNIIKENYKNVLTKIEISEIFDKNKYFDETKKEYNKQLWLFSGIWIGCIIIVFIITEITGNQSICKQIIDCISKSLH